MNFEQLIKSLESSGRIFSAIFKEVSEEDAAWVPPSGNWSILEIVCHLVDEEVEDFRTRVRMTLDDPTIAWPVTDPEEWAVARDYRAQDFQKKISQFVDERAMSLVWLRSLDQPDWNSAYDHAKIGEMRAGDIMAAWVAHDRLHLRQMAKRLYEMTIRDAGEFNVNYAGDW